MRSDFVGFKLLPVNECGWIVKVVGCSDLGRWCKYSTETRSRLLEGLFAWVICVPLTVEIVIDPPSVFHFPSNQCVESNKTVLFLTAGVDHHARLGRDRPTNENEKPRRNKRVKSG